MHKAQTGFAQLLAIVAIGVLAIGALLFTSKLTVFNGDNRSSAKVLSDVTVDFSVAQSSDVANQDGNNLTLGATKAWIGNGENASQSYLGLYFTGASLPQNTQVKSATLDFTAEGGWIGVSFSVFGDTSNAGTFSQSSKPGSRSLTSSSKGYSDNVKWEANQVYSYDVTDPVKELVGTSGKNSLALILKGTGIKFGRKNVFGNPSTGKSPKLRIVYTTSVTQSPTISPTKTPTASPTITPTSSAKPTTTPGTTATPKSTPQPPVSGGDWVTNAVAAASFGLWDPNNTFYQASIALKYPNCPKSLHDSYFVIGPDGKKYPTWHPPVVTDPATGKLCTFGHEHGMDPTKSALWPVVQQRYYFDANKNGKMDPEEQKYAGVPFGYANEQLDVYSAANGTTTMRHEDHVGHKISYVNGEDDAGDELGTGTTGGINVPLRQASGNPKWLPSGAKCYYFVSMHQGVHSGDAFGNNLHAVMFFADCKGPTAAYDMKASVTELVPFGAPGEFTNICDPEGDRSTPVVIGKNESNAAWPGVRDRGFRGILQRNCLEKYFLTPAGKFSINMYEAWAGSLFVRTPDKKAVLGDVNLTLDVEDAIRYYYPGQPNNVGYAMDLCYETLPNGNKYHGGFCDTVTNYGRIKGIKWNDPRSGVRDLLRGMYFQGPRLFNAGGPEVWYTDPFGGNAQRNPFPGSIMQTMSSKNVDYLNLGNIDPRVNNRTYDDGQGTVHAPN